MKSILLSVWLLPLLAIAQEAEVPKLEVTDSAALLANEGVKVIVTGKVVNTGISASGINFLNFENSDFACVTFARNLGAFTEGSPAELYDGKAVEISGTIEMYRGAPQIRLEGPEQVKILKQAPALKPEAEMPKEVTETETPAETEIPKPEPKAAPSEPSQIEVDPDVELVDGQPPVDWRKYFPQ
tara:strand:- start:1451 stop:2005 length:555 start_codon:yes stop_codon:yes gene_type:complete